MIAGVTIAFHMHNDVCSTVLVLFHHCYPTMLLKYLVVVDRHISVFCTKNIVNMPVIFILEALKGDRWCFNSFIYT